MPARSRRRRMASIVATAIVFLGAGYWIVAAAFRPPEGARLVLPRYPLHLGDGKPGETLRGHFDLFNAGDRPLEFKLVAGCSCSELKPISGRISPGRSQRIGIGVRLERVAGSSKEVRVTVNSNDESKPSTTYRVTAHCPMPFHISPTVVRFGEVVQGTSRSTKLTIRRSDHPGAPSLDGLSWTVAHAAIDVEATLIGPNETVLQLRLAPDAPAGVINGTLTLTAESGGQLDLTVCGDVVGKVATAPRVVYLGNEPASTARVLVWRSDRHPLPAASRITTSDTLAVTDVTPPGAVRRIYEIQAAQSAEVGAPNVSSPTNPDSMRSVQFVFKGIDEPILLPVH